MDLTSEQKEKISSYMDLFFSKSYHHIIKDYYKNYRNNTELRKYRIKDLVRFLEHPESPESQREIRHLSQFLYEVSSHYRLLINYYSNILYYDYLLIPMNSSLVGNSNLKKDEKNKEDYTKIYYQICQQTEKYNLKHIPRKIIRTAIRDGVFFGICYETDENFWIERFNPDFAFVSHIKNGIYKWSMDLEYFTGRRRMFLNNFNEDVINAFYAYRGNEELGLIGDPKKRFYTPKNSICILADDTDAYINLPLFTGLLKDIFDIEDYRLIKKANDENTNFKAVTMKVETDDDGIPKLNKELLEKYYIQACGNVPDGVGVIMSPMGMDSISFTNGQNYSKTELADAESQFWFDSGTSPLLFGSAKATSSGALKLSVKPNEQITFNILSQIEHYFNYKIFDFHKKYKFKIKYSDVSIFNEEEKKNADYKAATMGVAGSKLKYASDLGFTPNDVLNLAFLEDEILHVAIIGEGNMFNNPLHSSYTESYSNESSSQSDSTVISDDVGRPTVEESGTQLSDAGEKTRENK